MTRALSMAAAKASFSELVSRASAGERFLLLRRGKPVATLVGPKDLEILEASARSVDFIRALEKFRKRRGESLPRELPRIRRSRPREVD